MFIVSLNNINYKKLEERFLCQQKKQDLTGGHSY